MENIVIGIDCSINGTAVVAFQGGVESISNIQSFAFTTVKKNVCVKKDCTVTIHSADDFTNEYHKYDTMCKYIMLFIDTYVHPQSTLPVFVALEGYSMHSQGRVFNIAEMTAWLKRSLYEKNLPFRTYSPPSIKQFFTGFGNADKVHMGETFEKMSGPKANTYGLPVNRSPYSDIVDAFAIAQMLHVELLLRGGILDIEHLPKHWREAFTKTSKSRPHGYLEQDFIKG